ncbi:Zn-dependent hydrolase [Halovivax cerinus]|uniref:Zn-dependent hydrolase n=1 Tax=Halovivax cerinus TaxID=1487865 RepID=A0ABD5NS90_9EURY|nr:Zn-dependent hydrolase [Halovivax cerinus]
MTVEQDRLRADIEANATFGAVETEAGHGRTVYAGTEANRRARDRLVERMEDADLDVVVDPVGTILGVWTPPTADPDAAPVVAGSHLDSVPQGGIFDGPLGVYAALEAVRSLQAREVAVERPIGVVSFTEEEGARFGGGMLGSAVATGQRRVEDALALEDDEGVTLADALDGIGYRGETAIDASEWDAFLELHVEQDTRLEAADVPAGIVTTITGIAQADARFDGEANHAGATPMDARRDALAAASEFVLAVEEAGRTEADAGDNTAVATVGSAAVAPNGTNVVPGAVDLGVDVRDVERGSMERIFARLDDALDSIADERLVDTSFERVLDVDPAPMSDRCRDALESGAEAAGVETMAMHSGAAHDAMRVSRVTDAGMLFAPSRDGLSHNPREWTDWADCAAATRVLERAIGVLGSAE